MTALETFVIRPDGVLDAIVGRAGSDDGGRTYRLRWGGHATWYPEDRLRVATYYDFRAASLGTDVRNLTASRAGAITEGPQGRRRGTGAHVVTPYCGAGHYLAEHHGSVTCRGCGWHYLVRYFPGGTFWVSLGFGKTRRRRRA